MNVEVQSTKFGLVTALVIRRSDQPKARPAVANPPEANSAAAYFIKQPFIIRHCFVMGLMGLAIAGDSALAAAADQPNILFIMADDLGPEWIGCYGSEHQTPNIDRLAETGTRFDAVYATPLCTPTRHQLLTGRYPFRTGWTVHHDSPRWGGQYFDWNREITYARVLRSAGYATAIAGKWQINDLRTHADTLDRHGFDEHCVWPGYETGNPPAAERYFDPFIQHNGRRQTREGEFGPDIFRDFLIDFMTRHRHQPFLAYYAMVLPHTPFTHTPANRGTELKGIPLHPGMVDYIDEIVGRLVETLDALKLRERTLVIFTSDNGTVLGVRGRVGELVVNGGKGKLSEAGIRVPFVANWRGRVPAGRTSRDLIDFSDLFPTFIELAGAELPADLDIDGRSFAAELQGRQPRSPKREWIYSQLGQNRVVREERYKLYSNGKLYDVLADSLEERDLAGSEDPAVVEAYRRLARVLESLPPDARLPFKPRRIED